MSFDYKPGSLVTVRNRPWVVLPSDDRDVLLLKPLGGSEDEITGIYKPLGFENDNPASYDFNKPDVPDLGDFQSAKLLYNASRLSFRNAAGPFRCMGRLSFRPRAYQMVPMIMALRQEKVRLLIADDVGVGKTIEGLLIAKELFDRKEIKQFAVVCLPHLCDQWQDELKSKFGIEAVIIRSGTATGLERQLRTHENIFRAYPFQVISIDYIKSGNKRQVFLDHCPEMILVDEAHTCAKPAGANHSQQLRHDLLYELSKKKEKHLILLTATPHSGKQEEFQSLLGLLKPEFVQLDITRSSEQERKDVAKYFVQRRRGDIVKWLDEETRFPVRNSEELPYIVGSTYGDLFNDILSYARDMVTGTSYDRRKQRYSYWDALALLRGVMSSPAAGAIMLRAKAQKKRIPGADDDADEVNPDEERDQITDGESSPDDNLSLSALGKAGPVEESESRKLYGFAKRMEQICGIDHDQKAREALSHVKNWIDRGYNPIIFCRYIQTANYLGRLAPQFFTGRTYKNLHIEVVTSELNDELRKEKIELMNKSDRRLLIATDCLSEGINLQQGFTSLLHYDLPWNPNRLEQREGRIDRFGQQAPTVEVTLLYGSNNPIDGVVLDVLLRKAKEIRKSTGISVPFPENSSTVMEAVTNAVFFKPGFRVTQHGEQLVIPGMDVVDEQKQKVSRAFDEAAEREKASRSIFAQNAIKANEIEDDLKAMDDAIGDVEAVELFITEGLRFLGVQVEPKREGYKIYTVNIPERLREFLTDKHEVLVSFKSPTPDGYRYIGRNHPFTENLSQTLINHALTRKALRASRASVIRTNAVDEKTVLFQFRVRNVIAEKAYNKEIVAEEMWLWGYLGDIAQQREISPGKALKLLLDTIPSQNVEPAEQQYWLEEEMKWVHEPENFRRITDPIALKRAENLVQSHVRVRKLVKGDEFKVVEPVLPMDVMGIYILLPVIK